MRGVVNGPLTRRQAEIARLVADGKSSREIAAALFVSPRTVDNHVTAIFGKLGVSSRIELAITLLGRGRDVNVAVPNVSAVTTNLPLQRTSLVGRVDDIAAITRMLEENRLVTVTGAGGVGKTRAALATGDRLLESLSAGVWFVELAPLTQESFVGAAIARALNVQAMPNRAWLDTLLAYLKQKSLLLILDNCEHVIGEAAVFAEALLRGCPKLRILATSREPLRIAGEQRHNLPSLAVPAATDSLGLSAHEAADYAAVTLFAQRARAIDDRFALTDETAPIVADICRRLDGIPLAIEMAARRVNILPVLALSAVLDKRFGILTNGERTALPRHQTMRAVIDWSYELLHENERSLLRRLSVFVNGCTREGAVALSAHLDGLEVIDLLASLEEKSMLAAELQAGAFRYRLLESTRMYALEKLRAAGEHQKTVNLRLRYLRDVFCEVRRRVERSGCSRQLDELLAAELEDVRGCLDCIAESSEFTLGAELLAAIDNRWHWIDLTTEGIARLERVIALTRSDDPGLAARLWTALARTVTHDEVRARAASSMAVGLARKADEPHTLAGALTMHADALARPGASTIDDAPAALAEAESLLPRGNLWLYLRMRRVRANALRFSGDFDAAAHAYETLRARHLRLGNADEANNLAVTLAEMEHERKQTEKAVTIVQEALPALGASRFRGKRMDALKKLCGYLIALNRPGEAWRILWEIIPILSERGEGEEMREAVVLAALILALEGDVPRSAKLAGFVDSFVNVSDSIETFLKEQARSLGASLEQQLAPDELRTLRAAGAMLSLEGAIALVRGALDDRSTAANLASMPPEGRLGRDDPGGNAQAQ